VYPIIRDRTIAINQPCSEPNPNGLAPSAGQTYCQYQAIAPTGYHVGNSAYFTPSTRGSYQIQLQVSDGCSTTTDTVFIVAECPVLSATAAQAAGSTRGGDYTISKAGSAVATIDLVGTATYAADASVLTFGWSAGQGAPGAVTFSSPSSKATTASFSVAGVYNVLLSVTDKCQTVFFPVPAITVTCNAGPQAMNLIQVAGTGNSVLYSGTSFGPLRVRASAIDADPLTYSFTLVGSNGAGVSTGAEFEFTPIANGAGNQTFTINSLATDGCSTSMPATIQLTAQCKPGLTPRATIGTGRQGSATVIEYDPTASNKQAFPTVSVDGSTTVWPYDGIPGSTKVYSWNAGISGTSSGIVPNSITFQGQGTATIVLTPTAVGAHLVVLTVNDGCQSAISTVSFETRCSTIAVAVITASPGTSVLWDSFKSTTAGGFPSVTLNGSSSTGYPSASMELSYTWAVASGNAVPVQFGNTVGAVTTFTPTKGATYGFVLSVQNGPCPVSNPAVVTITATCNTLIAVLRQGPTLAASGQGTSSQVSVALESRWDGSKFPTVELDGMDVTYTQSGGRSGTAAQQSGNLRSLKYTWNVVQSPICSCYGQESGPNLTVTSSVDSAKAASLVSQGNASLVINDVSWTTTSITSTVSTTTTLANHHYLLPHTCLKPDCPGAYKVVLTIDDGCTTNTATATINAFCGTAPAVSIDSSAANTQKLQGTKFSRMNLIATVAGSDFTKETLSYQWQLLQVPAGSRLKVGSAESITNGQMPLASIVPDRAGVYIVQFSADDGCNPPATTTSLFTVQCNSTLAIASAVSTVSGSAVNTEIKWVGGANAALSINNFGNKDFNLVGKVSGTCNTLSTRWRLVSRACADATDISSPGVTPPPTATCTRCALNCSWAITTVPCDNTTINVGYLPPKLVTLPGSTATCNDKITFTPQYPGTYTLTFTVADCCGTSSSAMKVVAKCQTGIKANVGSTTVNSIFACQASGSEDWLVHTLQGNPTADPNVPTVTTVATCPVSVALPSCANKPANCCPTSTCCGGFKCPQCPQCAQCPQCPGYTSATAGSADYEFRTSTEINAFTAQAEAMSSAMANGELSNKSVLTG
jgi:hypothetical protein